MRIRFIFLSFLLSPNISNAQKMSIETTLAKASKDWKKLEAMFGSSTITYIKKEPYIPGNPPINVYGKIYSTGESICKSSLAPENFREPNKNLRNRVTCSNSDYSFIIGKKENATSFVASFIGKEGEKFSQQLASTKVTRGIMTYVMGKSMLTWLNDSEFTLHTIEATSENGQNLVRFDCSRLTSDKDEKSAYPQVKIYFDPENKWCVKSYETKTWYGILRCSIEYDPSGSNLMMPKKITENFNYSDPKSPNTTGSIEFEKIDFGAPSLEVFKLSFYGLPEPEKIIPNPNQKSLLWIWLLFGSFGLAIISLILKWRLKKLHSMET